jgi:hypothetical protein
MLMTWHEAKLIDQNVQGTGIVVVPMGVLRAVVMAMEVSVAGGDSVATTERRIEAVSPRSSGMT